MVNELESIIDIINTELGDLDAVYLCRPELMYSFDVDMPAEEEIQLADSIQTHIRDMDMTGEGGFYYYSVECREEEGEGFFGTNGRIFFLPLVTAALHICFAFPMVQKLLELFNLRNTTLMLLSWL